MNGPNGRFNQAGDLAPKTGPQSRFLRAHLAQLSVAPEPVVPGSAFNDFVGATVVRGVKDRVIVASKPYGGDLPAALQPRIERTAPWDSVGE